MNTIFCRIDFERLPIGVKMIPGAYALTVMPYLRSSAADMDKTTEFQCSQNNISRKSKPVACVRPRTANLEAEYAAK